MLKCTQPPPELGTFRWQSLAVFSPNTRTRQATDAFLITPLSPGTFWRDENTSSCSTHTHVKHNSVKAHIRCGRAARVTQPELPAGDGSTSQHAPSSPSRSFPLNPENVSLPLCTRSINLITEITRGISWLQCVEKERRAASPGANGYRHTQWSCLFYKTAGHEVVKDHSFYFRTPGFDLLQIFFFF